MELNVMRRILILVLLLLPVFAGCRLPSADQSQSFAVESGTDRAWLDKAARLLRYGDGLTPQDPLLQYLDGEKGKAVDILMADKRFESTLLDFHFYYLGVKLDKFVKNNSTFSSLVIDDQQNLKSKDIESSNDSKFMVTQSFDRKVFEFPSAITAVRNLVNNKNYFDFFAIEQPHYVDQNSVLLNLSSLVYQTTIVNKKPAPNLEILEQDIQAQLKNLGDLATQKQLDLLGQKKFCDGIEVANNKIAEKLAKMSLNDLVTLDKPPSGGLSLPQICFISGAISPRDITFYAEFLAQNSSQVSEAFNVIRKILKSKKQVSSISDILALQDGKLGSQIKDSFFSDKFWQMLPNSSTNFNRKRSAYILKTFFCDDLTPLDVDMPKVHVDNRHASDPNCAACHYKLDPMAGFFKDHGIGGIKFEDNYNLMIFDDLAQIKGEKVAQYKNSWLTEPDSGQWNIGVVRSASDPSKNIYGNQLEDLTKIIAKSPQAHLCLTRRMAEYVLGKDQVFDADWLANMAKRLTDAANSNNKAASSIAFKSIFKDLVLSKTFITPNPEPGTCYDFAPGQQASKVPCAISAILRKNCVSCHDSDSESGGLNLTVWSSVENSSIPETSGSIGFKHIGDTGKQLPYKVSMEKIKERISSNKSNPMMPLGKFMDPVERSTLFKWLEMAAKK